ncbi:TRL domain-containing protein [Treponema endosymbiont of Eucomonympha sp.]|uniref:TRL domain-containing protein n=1 Tax=Treponema endosymbiont of Eucomonympha sp. TaxID=1580831 RepID=UPI000750B9F7|nr:TRL domain-containing protein [Treponema endosymbiont of Eucomonympha sp.]
MKKRNVRTAAAPAAVIAGALTFALATAGCVSVQARSGFMDGYKPLTIVSVVNANSIKTGKLTTFVWLNVFGTNAYPAIADVAKESDITKVATVEYYIRRGPLGLWTEYTTVVTGE